MIQEEPVSNGAPDSNETPSRLPVLVATADVFVRTQYMLLTSLFCGSKKHLLATKHSMATKHLAVYLF